MYLNVRRVAGIAALTMQLTALAQPAATAAQGAARAKSGAASSAKTVAPIQTQFKAYRVHFMAGAKEELEPASSVSPGDVVEYAATHRNVSQRRLLNVDFAIPVPHGTTLWQGSVKPDHGKFLSATVDGASKDQARVVWRVERFDPGQAVELKLRVSIDPDPTLGPVRPANPFAPRQPELRRP